MDLTWLLQLLTRLRRRGESIYWHAFRVQDELLMFDHGRVDAFWLTPTFSAVLAGPYVDGRGEPCEGGGLSAALTCVDYLLSRVNLLGINPELVQRLMGLGEVQRHELMSWTTEETVLLAHAHALQVQSHQVLESSAVGPARLLFPARSVVFEQPLSPLSVAQQSLAFILKKSFISLK